jgi:GMP synthase (glutamine-hydrolysing)
MSRAAAPPARPSAHGAQERTAWALQHHDAEPPAIIQTVLRRQHIHLEIVRPDRTALPRVLPPECSALIIMGGPMGVYDHERLPWIVRELELIRDALDTNRPILGMCLGAQMLAAAGGANVYPGEPPKEIGWSEIKLTSSGRSDPLSKFLANPTTDHPSVVFQWHGDTFDLPSGAVALATSPRFPQQAYRLGRTAYGFQFHFEVTEQHIRHWVTLWRRDLAENGIDPLDVLSGMREHLPMLNRRGEEIIRAFAGLVQASPVQVLREPPPESIDGAPPEGDTEAPAVGHGEEKIG